MHRYLFALIYLTIFSVSKNACINVGGILSANTIWQANKTFDLISDVVVPANIALTIESGAQIRYHLGDYKIHVYGSINVAGTSLRPVRFYNGQSSNVKWMITMEVDALSSSQFKYARFVGLKKALQFVNSSTAPSTTISNQLVIESCTFQNTSIDLNRYYAAPIGNIKFQFCNLQDTAVSSAYTSSERVDTFNSNITRCQFSVRTDGTGFRFSSSRIVNSTFDQYNSSVIQISNSIVTGIRSSQHQYGYLDTSFTLLHSTLTRSNIAIPYNSIRSQYQFTNSSLTGIVVGCTGSSTCTPQPIINIDNCTVKRSNFYVPHGLNYFTFRISYSTLDSVYFQQTGAAPNGLFQMSNSRMINSHVGLYKVQVKIYKSIITGHTLGLTTGKDSIISCTSIRCTQNISNPCSVGVSANTILIEDSSIYGFNVGVQLNNFLGAQGTSGSIILRNSNLYRNVLYNLKNGGPVDVFTSRVWWGTANAGVVRAKIYDHFNNTAYGTVHYLPFSATKLPAEQNCPY